MLAAARPADGMPEAAAQSARPASNRGSAAWVPVDEGKWNSRNSDAVAALAGAPGAIT